MQHHHSILGQPRLRALLACVVLGACAVNPVEPQVSSDSSWHGQVESWGTLREALRDGQVEGRVVVADVARKGVWGVGALENLRGEITIVDGEVWISEGAAARAGTKRTRDASAKATVLFAAEVPEWTNISVEADVPAAELDVYIAEHAQRTGLDLNQPFPFVVEGGLRDLSLHVIAGECPMRARMQSVKLTSPPFELAAAESAGLLVGIFATDSSGVLCHMGSRTHIHATLEEGGDLTGHVESVGLARGAVLRLPRQRAEAANDLAVDEQLELTQDEIEVLHAALDDEYRALAIYDRVIADFGEVRPFSNIRRAEARHIGALERLFERYQLPVPENPWVGQIESFPSLKSACEGAVVAEVENGAMYDRLLSRVERADITGVFRNLQAASLERHLPAFRRCAARY